MKPSRASNNGLWPYAAIGFLLLAFTVHFPVLLGWAPFPRDQVLQFPPWSGFKASSPHQQVANIGDVPSQFYPFRDFAGEAVGNGSLPLWNPHLLAGSPFLANAQSALFYPATALYYFLPTPIAWTISILLHTFLAGFFTWLFVKSMGASGAGAALAGVVFACCGFITGWQGQPMNNSAVWLPLMFYSVHRLAKDLGPRLIALTASRTRMP
jgi:hypothetical protein